MTGSLPVSLLFFSPSFPVFSASPSTSLPSQLSPTSPCPSPSAPCPLCQGNNSRHGSYSVWCLRMAAHDECEAVRPDQQKMLTQKNLHHRLHISQNVSQCTWCTIHCRFKKQNYMASIFSTRCRPITGARGAERQSTAKHIKKRGHDRQ